MIIKHLSKEMKTTLKKNLSNSGVNNFYQSKKLNKCDTISEEIVEEDNNNDNKDDNKDDNNYDSNEDFSEEEVK
jgi:hypothetical protein